MADNQELAKEYFDRAFEYWNKSKSKDALAECEKAIEIAPEKSEVHNLRGVILDDLNRSDVALVEYREAVRLDPTNKSAKENLADASGSLEQALAYLKKRKYKDALQECDLVIKNNPNLPEALDLRQIIQDRKELYSRGGFSVIFGLALIFSSFSESSIDLSGLGTVAVGLGIFLFLEGIFVAFSGLTIAFLIDGIAICLVGMWNLGVSLFAGDTNLLFAGLGVFQLFWGVMGIIGYSKKRGVSIAAIESQISVTATISAQDISPEIKNKLREASKEYEDGRHPKKVLKQCEEILQINPDLAMAHNLKGMVLEDLNRPDEAILQYQESLRLEPSFTDAEENLSSLEKRMK